MNQATPADVIGGRILWCLCLGDGVTGVAALPTGCLDAVITDPPYNIAQEGGDIKYSNCPEVKVRDFGEWDRAGWNPIPTLNAISIALRRGGTLLVFTSDQLISTYREHSGFKTRGVLVWEKANPAPSPRPQYVQTTEHIMWLQRPGKPSIWNGNGYCINVLHFPVCAGDERTEHPTQKPEALIKDLIRRHTNRGELVCDPYSGSGTIGTVCRRLGRRFIGWEIDPEYHAIAMKRIEAAHEQIELFTPTTSMVEPEQIVWDFAKVG